VAKCKEDNAAQAMSCIRGKFHFSKILTEAEIKELLFKVAEDVASITARCHSGQEEEEQPKEE
jgi:hypothetical protein